MADFSDSYGVLLLVSLNVQARFLPSDDNVSAIIEASRFSSRKFGDPERVKKGTGTFFLKKEAAML
jgi:hypothetical protein